MSSFEAFLRTLLGLDGIIHPILALAALVLPFLFIERVVLKRRFLQALLPLVATLAILFLLFYVTLGVGFRDPDHPVAYDPRLFAFLSIPVAFLFLCEPGQLRDRLLRISVVLLAVLSLNQFILVKTGTMTGNGETDKTNRNLIMKNLGDNYKRVSQLPDKEKYYPPAEINSDSEIWQDIRNAGGDWPDQLLLTKVIVETATSAWHSFFTDLYWCHRRSEPLYWAGGLPIRSWFHLESESVEQGRVRWEEMLDDRFPLGRPAELESQHLTTEPADVVPIFEPSRPRPPGMPPPGAPAPPGPPPAPPAPAECFPACTKALPDRPRTPALRWPTPRRCP